MPVLLFELLIIYFKKPQQMYYYIKVYQQNWFDCISIFYVVTDTPSNHLHGQKCPVDFH